MIVHETCRQQQGYFVYGFAGGFFDESSKQPQARPQFTN